MPRENFYIDLTDTSEIAQIIDRMIEVAEADKESEMTVKIEELEQEIEELEDEISDLKAQIDELTEELSNGS